MNDREREIADLVRKACVETLLEAYEEAGVQGLCDEGRFEVAVDALKEASVEQLLGDATDPRPSRPV